MDYRKIFKALRQLEIVHWTVLPVSLWPEFKVQLELAAIDFAAAPKNDGTLFVFTSAPPGTRVPGAAAAKMLPMMLDLTGGPLLLSEGWAALGRSS